MFPYTPFTNPPLPPLQAHYDDLKKEFDAASAQLEKTQAELERAKGEAQALADRLDAANFKVHLSVVLC